MSIKLVDLGAQYETIKKEIDGAISQCIEEGRFISGEAIGQFEKEFAAFSNANHCIACSNGTDALEICLRTLNIGAGDEVIIPAMTFIATAEAVTICGASVIFCDIKPDTYTIDTDQLVKKITKKTKAIIPVHLYGQMANMNEIQKIAKDHDLLVIEDSAQAHGASFDGKPAGFYSQFATYSFYPGKNLGAFGDAGAITTNDEKLRKKAKMWTNHGRVSKYDHEFEGRNSRMDTLQAYILLVKLKHLSVWNENRRKIARLYDAGLESIPQITLPYQDPLSLSVYHLYVIRVNKADRDKLLGYLKKEEVFAGIHYPIALPFLKAYSYKHQTQQDFPIAYECSESILSLPMYPEMPVHYVERVVKKIKDFYQVI